MSRLPETADRASSPSVLPHRLPLPLPLGPRRESPRRSRGYRVASDGRNVDECVLRFWPPQTATYRIRVVNWGIVYNEYKLLTN